MQTKTKIPKASEKKTIDIAKTTFLPFEKNFVRIISLPFQTIVE